MRKKIYDIQNLFLTIVLIFVHRKIYSFFPSWIFCIFIAILLISLIPFRNDRLNKIIVIIQAVVQPLALVYAWTQLFYLCSFGNTLGIVLQAILLLYYCVLFIPFAFQVASRIKNTFLQLLFILWQFNNIVLMNSAGPNNLFIKKSMIIGAVAYLFFVLLVMHNWGYSLPRLHGTQKLNILVIITITIITLIEVILNVAEDMPSFTVIVHRMLTQPIMFLSALEAGIAEELTFRYASFGLLFYIFRKKKWRLSVSILLATLLFACAHLVNLEHQDLESTLVQMTFAVSMGILFSIVYLCSGKLIITMLLHFIIDWGISIVQGSTVRILGPTMKYVTADIPDLIELGIMLIFFAWIMHGKRRQVMEEHARALIGE